MHNIAAYSCWFIILIMEKLFNPDFVNLWRRKGILNMAKDWELRVDLEKKLVFPPLVETT